MRTWLSACVLAVVATASAPALAAGGEIPDITYTADLLYAPISPQLRAEKHNQPSVVDGHLMLSGNGIHTLWDISDPFAPVQLSEMLSPHHDGECESHQVAFSRSVDGATRAVTISGRGVDLWDLSDATAPTLLAAVELEGIDYGDNSHAVWGVFWQGEFVYVGGTNTGLHIIDATDPTAPVVVARVPTSELGGMSAGPLFALGNLLVITTPKNHAGIVTLDIGDPAAPALLDFEVPDKDSYIGWMYGGNLHLLTPFRTYDVTTDPTDIQLVASFDTVKTEYMSFADGFAFVGALRPEGGLFKYDLADPAALVEVARIPHRKPNELAQYLTDDQFSLAIGNLVVVSDDEMKIGSVLTPHSTQRDTKPPQVAVVNPPDGAVGQPLTTRVGVSFTDQIDLRSVDTGSFTVRPVGGGAALSGSWGHMQTFVTFWPSEPLQPDTTYEVVLAAGGVTDLVGNPLPEEFRSEFSTGLGLASLPCHIETSGPAATGADVTLAGPDEADLLLAWDFGDGTTSAAAASASVQHAWPVAGRHRVTLTVSRDGKTRACSAVQVVHRPLASGAPAQSSPVIVDAAGGRAWTANTDAATVTAVDLDALEVALEAPVGAKPRTLAVAPDGRIWVACQGDDRIDVLDATDGALVDSVVLRWGAAPFGIAFAPDGTRAYVSLEATGQIAVLDAASREVLDVVDLGPAADGATPRVRGIAVSPDGTRVLAARFVSAAGQGEVIALDAATGAVVRTFALAPSPGPDVSDGGRGVPNYLAQVAIGPSGERAWVAAKKDNTARGAALDGQALNTTNTVRTIVATLDLAAGAELPAARVDLDDHNLAQAVRPSPLGDLVFVASVGTHQVDALDAETGALVAGFGAGLGPAGMAFDGDGRLFVLGALSRTLTVMDASGLLAGRDTAAPVLAEVALVAEEPLSEAVLLGKQLFHAADSTQISQDGYISCATCHLDGGEDGRVWDFTDRGEGLRNTIDLRGRAGVGQGRLHWTGNFDEVQDFENDIRLHFGGSGLLDDADWEAEGVSDPLGAPKAGMSERLDALAAYVTSLASFPRSPWRNPDGTRTEAAVAGEIVFRKRDCMDCHSGQALTDSASGARHDVGTITALSGQRIGAALDGFDTPTIRGVWASPPFFHDGSAATLRDVIERPGHGNAQDLSAEKKDQLVAFMRELESEDVDLERLPPDPPEPEPEPETPAAVDDGCAGGSGPAAPVTMVLLALVWWAVVMRRRRRSVMSSQSTP